ncbi:MAG: twin-arginine translocase subunit TatC [Verrucomicrobiota bacterium]
MSEIVPTEEENEEEEQEDWASDPKRMGFLDHLEELRWTLLKPLAVFVVSFVLTLVFISRIKDFMFWPLLRSLSEEEQQAFQGLATMNITGVFTAMLQIGLLVAVTVASPFFVYYVGRFIAPALKKSEQRALIPGAIGTFVFFLLGCSFGFFFLLPLTIAFTIKFNDMMGFQIIWTTGSYFSFITWTVLGMGLSFQLPLAIMVLNMLGIVTVQMLRKFRRIMAVLLVVLAALLTPPDPVTQMSLAIPMYLLYELAIWIAAIMEKKREIANKKYWEKYDDDDDSYGEDGDKYLH